MDKHEKINYLELPAGDLTATKAFFEEAFGWEFQDYGPDYTAFNDGVLDGGFFRAEQRSRQDEGGALVILYSRDLETTLQKVVRAGGTVIRDIFSFPGGRRFHFTEPSGNELAVWSDQGLEE
ncbi:MAG: VOC family protein [Balneolaceae bacterium]|nr:VOC family protein [Balneolaceae bacterium]